jgi:hypothetical protein
VGWARSFMGLHRVLNTTISSVSLVNTRLPGVAMHLDLTDDETVALLPTETIEADLLPAIAAHPQAVAHPGEVRANGTGAAATG